MEVDKRWEKRKGKKAKEGEECKRRKEGQGRTLRWVFNRASEAGDVPGASHGLNNSI